LVARVLYFYTIFENFSALITLGGINAWILNISTLLSVISTTSFAINTLSLRPNTAMMLYFAVVLIHIILSGARFVLFYFRLKYTLENEQVAGAVDIDSLYWFFLDWSKLENRIIFFFAWTFFPLIAIVFKGTHFLAQYFISRILVIHKLDRLFFPR
jgi:hypothetical protein